MTLIYQDLQSGTHYFTTELQESVVFTARSNSNERSLGFINVGYYGPRKEFIITGVLNLQKGEFIEYKKQGFPFIFRIWIDKWITSPVTIEIFSFNEMGLSASIESSPLNGNLIELEPVPGPEGVVVAPGFAAFTAGTTTFQSPSETQPDYHQQYSVAGTLVWGIGAKSKELFSEGRIQFRAGTGRSVIGLAPQFESVDFLRIPWSWYVHDYSEIRPLDMENGSIKSQGTVQWSPDRELALRIENGRMLYEVRSGETWSSVYTSPHPVTEPLFLCVVLGPQALIVNCSIN